MDKDALDIFRLLQATPPDVLAGTIAALLPATPAHQDAQVALGTLREFATDESHVMPQLARTASGDDPFVAPSFAYLTGDLLRALEEQTQAE